MYRLLTRMDVLRNSYVQDTYSYCFIGMYYKYAAYSYGRIYASVTYNLIPTYNLLYIRMSYLLQFMYSMMVQVFIYTLTSILYCYVIH